MQQDDSRLHLYALLSALVLLGAGCVAQDEAEPAPDPRTGAVEQAIIGGESDAGDPAVVGLVLNKDLYCTGTQVSRNVILTAAHCVRYAPPDYVFYGSKLGQPGRAIGVARVAWHPKFNGDTLRNDVGLIELEEDGPAAPVPMATAPLEPDVGQEIRLVGFGVPRPGATKELEKRTGTTKITDVTPLDFRFHATPARTCLGDSGGPSFMTIDGREVLVGITSSGDLNCKVYGRHIRVDKYRAFIDPFIAEASIIEYEAKGSGCQASTSPGVAGAPRVRGDMPGALLFHLAALFWLGHRRARGVSS